METLWSLVFDSYTFMIIMMVMALPITFLLLVARWIKRTARPLFQPSRKI